MSSRLTSKIISGIVEEVISNLFDMVGVDGLRMYIENDWSLVEAMMMGLNESDEYLISRIPEELRDRFPIVKGVLGRVVAILLKVASKVSSMDGMNIDKYLNINYVINYLNKSHPEIIQVINSYGDKGTAWLQRNLNELQKLIKGDAYWDSQLKKLVVK